ncbi:MAG TPA: hypothetical protein VGE31_03150 [Candidatus Paceibacterota bacterium]
MADTIIHDARSRESGSAGEWVVSVVLIAAVVIIGFMLFRAGLFSTPAPVNDAGTDINVTLPANDTGTPAAPQE